METMNTINAISNQLAKGVSRWSQTGEALRARAFKTLSFELNSLSFETETAKELFKSLVLAELKAISPEAHAVMFPPVGMDANGNYTYDRSKWA